MAEEYTESLLENKNFHENCPGCKVDQLKRLCRGFPLWEFCSVWIIVLCTALLISSLFPFLYFMISDFGIAEKEEDSAIKQSKPNGITSIISHDVKTS